MELKKVLRLGSAESLRLAFVGAGGKTTAMFHLARELDAPVIVTTTTHLAVEQIQLADRHIILEKLEDSNQIEEMALSGVML